jgi:hypothetical protein
MQYAARGPMFEAGLGSHLGAFRSDNQAVREIPLISLQGRSEEEFAGNDVSAVCDYWA